LPSGSWAPSRWSRSLTIPKADTASHERKALTPRLTSCRAAYDVAAVGRIGPTGSPGPPAKEGMSRRRVPPQVTHPARTIIGTDSADAPGPVVGPRTWRCPNTPKPRGSTGLLPNALFCRSCKSRVVGPVENVSVGAVDCGTGRTRPDCPSRQHYPAGSRTPQMTSRRPTVPRPWSHGSKRSASRRERLSPPDTQRLPGRRCAKAGWQRPSRRPSDGVSTAAQPWPH
jgi:hypothetical protein